MDRVGAIVAEESRKLGAQVEVIPNQETGDHILVRFLPTFNLQPQTFNRFLLLCHMDTVFPLGTLPRMPYREADGKDLRSRRAGYESGNRHLACRD
ncbi:MAG: hypothetical protein MZU97_07330 [Bacillus subtilis]|nr:hypothetical protein [Bacillus subtilis]